MPKQYNYEKENWAEEEIIRLSKTYGMGDFIKYIVKDGNTGKTLPQSKIYGTEKITYPDIENRVRNKIYLLIEVKSRSEFYKQNNYLALKEYSYINYSRVEKEEYVDVRVVYLIGKPSDYELFWMDFKMFREMEVHKEYFQDIYDSKPYVYNFFHSSQLSSDVDDLFNLFSVSWLN